MDFYKQACAMKDDLLEMRRYMHQNAEIEDNLPISTAFVMKKLTELGLEPKEICKSGVVATIEGGKPGKTILLRSDMDALPMHEESNLPFSSKTEYAHTCGHDLHTSMLLGAAKMLVDRKDEICGRVKLMFQPAEEIFAGAAAMIESGLMESPKVDAAFDMHVMTELPCGTLGYSAGFVTSSCDGYKIIIKGKACHGAQPHNGVDPINVGAHMHIALQDLISRETPPDKIAVMTFGQFNAGSAPNIIPDTCVLQGTMRCYDKDLRVKLVKRFRELVEHTAKSFGAEAEIEILSDVPSITVDPDMLDACVKYVKDLDANFEYEPGYIVTASDDFARVSDLAPSAFFAIGASPDDISQRYPNHNPKVIFNEDCLPIGAALHAQCAFNWLADNA